MSRAKAGDIIIARAKLSITKGYYNAALWALKFVDVPEKDAKLRDLQGKVIQDLVMAVDTHWRLYYCKKILAKFSTEELVTFLIHELGHILRGHANRAKFMNINPVNHMAWNVVGDLEINDDIVADKMLKKPAESKFSLVTPEKMGFKPNLTAEQYYKLLPLKGLPFANCGSGAHGQKQAWEKAGEGAGKVGEQEAELIRKVVAEQINDMKTRGNVPGGLSAWANELLNPKVNWKRELAVIVRNAVAEQRGLIDYSYRTPCRRQSTYGHIIMPSMTAPEVTVAAVLDSSGSMNQGDLNTAVVEVGGILKAIGVRGVRYYCVDAIVQIAKKISSLRDVKILGRGGTDMCVGIERAMKDRPSPNVVVVITDGETPWPKDSIGAKMIVVIIDNKGIAGPPWAKTIHVDVEKES